MFKNRLKYHPQGFAQIIYKWIKFPSMRLTLKLWEVSTAVPCRHGMDSFLNWIISIHVEIEDSHWQIGPHKTTNLTPEETVSWGKRKPTEWERLLASHTADRGFIYGVHEKFKNREWRQQMAQLKNGYRCEQSSQEKRWKLPRAIFKSVQHLRDWRNTN